jgi:Ca2+-binding EF-hand superfamily protein
VKALQGNLEPSEVAQLCTILDNLKRANLTFDDFTRVESNIHSMESMSKLEEIAISFQKYSITETKEALSILPENSNL